MTGARRRQTCSRVRDWPDSGAAASSLHDLRLRPDVPARMLPAEDLGIHRIDRAKGKRETPGRAEARRDPVADAWAHLFRVLRRLG
jgi:hypothetical protein